MKKFLPFFLLLGWQLIAAQAPQSMNYQAMVRDNAGHTLTNQNITARFTVHNDSATGSTVYAETQILTTNAFGLITHAVGTGTPVSGAFSSINWGNGTKWLQVEVDVAGGTNYTNMGTAQLLSVPYALYAANGIPGATGATGPQGPTGAVGATGPQGATGTNGTNGITGATGPQGPAGANGTSVTIQGSVVTSSALPTSGNNAGDGYLTQDTGHLWVWDGNAWVDAGNIQGPQGNTGPTGAQGIAGNNGVTGATGPIGPQGATGPGGLAAAQDFTMLKDADEDTKVIVEQNTDDDTIRLVTKGVERWLVTGKNLEQLNSGHTTAVGRFAGRNDDGNDRYNAFYGERAGEYTTTGSYNTATGNFSFTANTTGGNNTALGNEALTANTTGNENTGVGNRAASYNTTGNSNVAVGRDALRLNQQGNYNVAVGKEAGSGNTTHNKTGSVYIGYKAGWLNQGSNNVFIGREAASNSTDWLNASNKLVIANSSTTPDGALVYGEFDNHILSINNRLGIGTLTPTRTLHTIGPGLFAGTLLSSSGIEVMPYNSPNAGGGRVFFREDVTDNWGFSVGYNGGNAGNEILNWPANSFNISSHANDSVGNIVICIPRSASGYIGIGTTTPQSKLDVNGQIRMVDGNQQQGYVITGTNTGVMAWTHPDTVSYNTPTLTGDTLKLNPGGMVNLHTISPRGISDDANSTRVYTEETVNDHNMYFYSAYNLRMILDTTGNLGINLPNPDSKLYVKDNFVNYSKFVATIENTGNGSGAGALLIKAGENTSNGSSRYIQFNRPDGTQIGSIRQSNATTITFATTSDERLKTNIVPTHYGLNNLLNIQVRDYNYKGDFNTPCTGFIAQQLYTQYPDAVSVGGDDAKTDPWMVDYGKLTPLVVKAIQDQQQLIDALQKQNQQMQQQLNELKALLNQGR